MRTKKVRPLKVERPKKRLTKKLRETIKVKKRRIHQVKKSVYLSKSGETQLFSPEILHVIKKTRTLVKIPQIGHMKMVFGYEFDDFGLYHKNKCEVSPVWTTPEFIENKLYEILTGVATNLSITLGRIIPQNKFDALVSLKFDLPAEIFKDSKVLRYCELGQYDNAALYIRHWDKLDPKKKKLDVSHTRRRKIDFNIFMKSDYTIIK